METISKIQVTKVKESKLPEVDFNNIQFGKQLSDHMFTADFKNGEWSSSPC